MKLGHLCPKVVRVYSEMQQNLDFPIPRDLLKPNKQRQKKEKLLEGISLHFLIRHRGKPYSEKIQYFDQLFRMNEDTPENVTDDQLKEYRQVIKKASIEELKGYDIVLCTCSGSSSKRLVQGTNIAQIIIDECAMCMEPEALIPLVAFSSAEKIVLIGDHKQLKPIVINRDAKNLGLDRSLFERYADKKTERYADKKTIMLNIQYRMV